MTLIALDELETIVEHSYLDIERLRLGAWHPLPCEMPVADWQQVLAANAGWHELAKWRCWRCGSVCPGEAAVVPSPCDYCQSTEIERVHLTTPLREPDPPWHSGLTDLLDLIASSTSRSDR